MMSLDTWEQFSKTCTSLRKFHWAAMPFADPFFSAFGAYPKMQLKELTLTANLLWTWKEYFKHCDHATATAIKNCHGKDAKNIRALFKGCPGLSRLIVEVDSQKYNPTPARLFTLDEYGDKFWGSVVTHCPLLRRLAIRNCSNFEEKTVTFTDVTLFKLAELKYLGLTESNLAVMCTGDGIFDFMRLVIEKNCRTGNTFEIDLRIGGQQGSVPRFYSVVIALLRRLAAVSEKDFGAAARRQKFEVYLANPYKSKLNKQWSGSYMCGQLRPLLERVQKQHPSLKASTHITGQTGDSFSRIDLLTLIWSRDHFGNNLFINGPDDEDYEPLISTCHETPSTSPTTSSGRHRAALSSPNGKKLLVFLQKYCGIFL